MIPPLISISLNPPVYTPTLKFMASFFLIGLTHKAHNRPRNSMEVTWFLEALSLSKEVPATGDAESGGRGTHQSLSNMYPISWCALLLIILSYWEKAWGLLA